MIGAALLQVCGRLVAVASPVGLRSLGTLRREESSWTRGQPCVSCTGRWALNPWMTREVLSLIFRGTARLCFQSGGTVMRSHPQRRKVPVPLNPRRHLLLSIFLITAILVGVKWYLAVALMCVSLMAGDIEQLSVYLLTTFCSLCKKVYSDSLPTFQLDYSSFCG